MFNCEGCCFTQLEDGKQVACLADKHKHLKGEDTKTENGVFSYDRLCLYKRRADWNKDKTDEERLEIARDQLFPNIGICLDDDSEDPSDLENIVDQLINIDYPKNRIGVVIYSRFDKAGARIPKILNKMKLNGIVTCSSVFIIQDNVFENETSVFKKLANATFLTKISSKSKVNLQKSFNFINKTFNDELQQVLAFKNEDVLFLDKSYVSRSYLEYLDYGKMQKAIYNKVTGTEFLHIIT